MASQLTILGAALSLEPEVGHKNFSPIRIVIPSGVPTLHSEVGTKSRDLLLGEKINPNAWVAHSSPAFGLEWGRAARKIANKSTGERYLQSHQFTPLESSASPS